MPVNTRTPGDYYDQLAVSKGYVDHNSRVTIYRLTSGRTKTSGERFWRDNCVKGPLNHIPMNNCFESVELNDLLCALAKRHYDQTGRITLNNENPNGAREAKVLIGLYLEKRSLEDIGRELGITRERVRKIGLKGLEHLRGIIGIN